MNQDKLREDFLDHTKNTIAPKTKEEAFDLICNHWIAKMQEREEEIIKDLCANCTIRYPSYGKSMLLAKEDVIAIIRKK